MASSKVKKGTHVNKWVQLSFLILGGGTIYKISSIKDVFYVPMQHDWGLTNTQIGLGFTFYAIAQTLGYFLSMYLTDRFSKKYLLPTGLLGVAACGLYLSSLPSFSGYVIAFAFLAIFGEVIYWPSLLKAVRLLGNKEEQGRLFGFLEAGRGVVDVIIASGALGVFVWFGEGKEGMQAGIIYYTLVTAIVGIITWFLLDDSDSINNTAGKNNANKLIFEGIKYVVRDSKTWLAAFVIFFVYSTYTGLTYFIPFLKEIYGLPVALVGAYGIINQYGLKMVGGPVGGLITDKIFKSPTKYLRFTFILAAVYIFIFTLLPHQSINVYLGMLITLSVGAIIFTQRAVFFAPMEEINTPRAFAGSAMAVGCLIGYLPSMFGFALYGHLLDTCPGMDGFRYVFYIMSVFSLCGFICASILARKIGSGNGEQQAEQAPSQRPDERSA
ncbi:MFS transporter [Salmonella enterica]|nr:MFS transporter [Salmonella enterica]EBV4144233.1 MFS transporter [Salmonella enterica subsp. enterica serovar Benin]EBE6989149.1 MFS transporter [Salmonella enterica]EBE7299570.1 MFS transporter [Salmonella enterica]EBW4219528.1 MFS transporter [Salmonella enterica subsp. enterica serovar Benin]